MLELKYTPGTVQSVKTQALGDNEIETVHFRTPTLKNYGAGGFCSFAADGNDYADIVLSLTTSPTEFKGAAVGMLSGSIRFVDTIPRLQNTDRYVKLESNADYYIKVQSIGECPRGVTVKLSAKRESRGKEGGAEGEES